MLRPDHLESLALHAALWGPPEDTFDAIDAGTLTADLFDDPIAKATALAILDVVAAGNVHEPAVVAEYLVFTGMDTPTAREAVLLAGTFEAAGFVTGGLAHYLHALAEDRDRRDLERRLVGLATKLHKPGGPARVAALLGATA